MNPVQHVDNLRAARRRARGWPRDRFERRLAALVGALFILVGLAFGLALWHLERFDAGGGGAQAALAARVADARVGRMVGQADQRLSLIASDLGERRSWSDARAATRLLRRVDTPDGAIENIALVNGQGVAIANSSRAVAAGTGYAGSDFFGAHRSAANLGLYLGKPQSEGLSGRYRFTLSRRISGADGTLLGIVVAFMRSDALAADLVALTLGGTSDWQRLDDPAQPVVADQNAPPGRIARTVAVLMAALFSGLIAGAAAFIVAAHRRRLDLQDELSRWQLAFEHAGWGVAIATASGLTLTHVNPAYARMHGYRPEELTGQAIDLVLPVASRAGLAEAVAATRKLGRHHYESHHRRRDGSEFPVAIDMTMVPDANDQVVCHIVNVRDVGELSDAHREARIAREFFQSTFAATPVGMVVTDSAGRYVRVNRAMCEFTGYSESELLGKRYADITHPDDVALIRVDQPADPALRYQSFRVEKRYRHKDGRDIWGLLTALRACDGEGKLLYWAGQVLDIDSLKRTELALRISDERFRGVFENANTGMSVADHSGRIAYFNDALRSLLGHDAQVLERMHFAELSFPEDRSFPADVARETALLDEILRKHSDRYRVEKRWIAADGRTLWVDLHVSAVRDESGAVVNFIAVVSDITERKKSALALRDSKQKLRALAAHQEGMLELERKHIAGEVHDEMGQLLTALKMDIALMRLRFGENVQLLGMIDEMRSLVERTINVVRQVASNLRPAVLDHGLAPAIEWLAADFSKRGTIRCRFDAGGGGFELPELQATAVFRVVQESLTNVTRHSQAREVVISMQRCGQLLQVVVRDDGKGFDTVAVGKSSGFGLFGMRERVLALGGSLRIVSAPELGTSVTIKLPLVNGEHP